MESLHISPILLFLIITMSEENQDNSNSNEKVNFFGKQVTRAQLQPFVKFYEADHNLTTEDRKVMATELNWISNSSQIWGMLDASLAFFAPTFYRRFMNSKTSKVAENVRNMPVRRFIHRPFLSTMIGTATFFVSVIYHNKNLLDYTVTLLDKEIASNEFNQDQREAKKRQLGVWKTMVPTQMTFYYLYYWKTSNDPSLVLKDPRTMMENPHEVHYIPPPQQNHGQHHENEAPQWAKIRAANGFLSSEDEKKDESEDEGLLDGMLEDPKEEVDSEPKRSAWDRVRRGNGT